MPLITLITRKSYGGAYDVMASKHIGADVNLAYPTQKLLLWEQTVLLILFLNFKDLKVKSLMRKKRSLWRTMRKVCQPL